MGLPKYIHGKEHNLPNTLASRVSFIRNARGIHILKLAEEARIPVDLIEAVESGIETWLSVAVRQRIARVLKVDPIILEEVEVKREVKDLLKNPPVEVIERIQNEIMNNIRDITCPLCGHPLKIWIQEGFDLNENPVKSPKAHCTECVFQLKI